MKTTPESSPSDWTPDSPDLTAFVLKDGPFDPAANGWAGRQAEAEEVVARSAPLRGEIGEIRRVADDLEIGLAGEVVHRLGSDRREAVLAYARNPGRGLPRRSLDDSSGEAATGPKQPHRLWSLLTRPALGLSLAAATALSIALALWGPWRRDTSGSRVASAPALAVSNVPAKPSAAVPRPVSGPPADRARAVDGPSSGSAETSSEAMRSAPGPASVEVPAERPRQEVVRGESQLSWGPSGGPRALETTRDASSKRASSAPSSEPSMMSRSAPSSTGTSGSSGAAGSARQARSTREIPFRSAAESPRSTFPLKPADTSYSEVRRDLQEGRLPSPDSVRLDELLNHFSYEYPAPTGSDPLFAQVEVADSPWSPDHRLVKIGLQARPARPAGRAPANLVVLVGLRPGSAARLSWAQRSLQALAEAMDGRDSMALLLEGPRGRVILPPTSGADRAGLLRGVSTLRAEGGPQGLEGLRRAYALAAQRQVPDGINRVLWILDGEFAAEAGTREALATLIREQTEWGILLSVLGLGSAPADVPDSPGRSDQAGRTPPASSWMPTPAGGAYASATTPAEAREVLQRELRPKAAAAADDVTVDVRFNPARVDRWRLIGQESREPDSGSNRRSSAGPAAEPAGVRMEAGESVTALYEIVPTPPGDRSARGPGARPGGGGTGGGGAGGGDDLLSLQVDYRPSVAGASRVPPAEETPRRLQVGVPDAGGGLDAATADYKFAAAVVGYGLLLRDSPFKGDLTWEKVQILAEEGQGPDREGYRREFLQLVRRARELHAPGAAAAPAAGVIRPRP